MGRESKTSWEVGFLQKQITELKTLEPRIRKLETRQAILWWALGLATSAGAITFTMK